MHCPRCAQLVPNGAVTCPRCGAPLVVAPSAITMNAQPQGGARPGSPDVDDIASTLVWQKGPGEAPPNAPAGRPGEATASHPHGRALSPQAPQNPNAPLGATAMANMMAATAVGMPPGFEEVIRAGAAGAPSANTLVGMPRPDDRTNVDPGAKDARALPTPRIAGPRPQPPADPAARTLVGVSMPGSGFDAQADTARQLPAEAKSTAASPGAPPPSSPSATAGGGATTLPTRVLGDASSGAAGPVPPARASQPRSAPSAAVAGVRPRNAPELGATAPPLAARKVPGVREPDRPLRKKNQLDKRLVVAPPKKGVGANRTGILAIAGGVIALVAVLVVVLWPGRGAVVARPSVDAEGRDGLDIECANCPDSTVVRVGSATSTIAAHHAFVPVTLPLGESKLEVVIDRPGNGKDESASVRVHLPYRVTTDLATLRGERPAIQVVVEAQDGTSVVLDGKTVPLVAGRAIDALDVSEAVTGESDEPRTLSRKIPYVVTPPGGSPEQGTLHVSVPITTLRINAPGSAVVTDKESFVLAGRTAKGVELFAGPHAIPLRPDGSFAHVMNVSAVGATQISVRAQGQGMAPRIVKIDVRRVESLEQSAREFASKSPLGLADLASDPKSKVGKNAMVSGLVIETKGADQVTVMRLRGFGGPACPALAAGTKPEAVGDAGPCLVELAVGMQAPFAPGDIVTGCGRFAGMTGDPEVPQVRADFLVKGAL